MLLRLITIFFLVSRSLLVCGQLAPGQYSSSNKKAIKHLQEGRLAYEQRRDGQAEKSFKKALDEDKNFVEAALGLATLYQESGKDELAIQYFKRALDINPRFFPNTTYFLSQSQLALGQYDDATASLQTFLKQDRLNPETKTNAQRLLSNATFASAAIKHPQP